MTLNCPLCGGPTQNINLMVDLDSNHAIVNGVGLRLRPREAEMLAVLVKYYPGPAMTERMLGEIYGAREEPTDALNVLHQRFFTLKKKLLPLGYTVINEHKRYRLAKLNQEEAA